MDNSRDYSDAGAYGFSNADDDAFFGAAPLSWRLDGSDSQDMLSDWTIVVTRPSCSDTSTGNDGEDDSSPAAAATTTYHVHKNMLAVGPNRSEYFASLFKCRSDVSELADSTSRIELENTAADAFPAMLDFVYSHDGTAHLTTENSVAVRYLSQYFQIRSLFMLVTNFVQQDLSPLTCPMYLSEAATYHDERLAKAAEDMCAEFMDDIDAESFALLPPELFRRILASEKMNCNGEYLSQIVSVYCNAHADGIDAAMFAMMTDEDIMPVVDPNSALPLLKALVNLSSSDQSSSFSGSNIKARCIKALSASWDKVMVAPQAIAAHRQLPQELQVELLETSLCAASAELEKTCLKLKRRDEEIKRRDEEIRKLRAASEAKLEEKDRVINRLEERVKRLNRFYPTLHSDGINES